MDENNKWFETWFDSPYYHKLYKHRNESEAENFIEKLVKNLNIEKGQKIWDHACGKGRHALAMTKLGLNVFGTDLSENSINEAKKYESNNLKFKVHDMRELFEKEKFDVVMNLFTSFGYFTNEDDYDRVFESVNWSLKRNGLFVIDFLNVDYVIRNYEQEKKVRCDNIDFVLNKRIENGFICNRINFAHNGKNFQFEEKVRLFSKIELEEIANRHNFVTDKYFGNYNLEEFDKITSNRLVIVFKKP